MKAEGDTITCLLRDDANELRHDLPALLVRHMGKLPNRNRRLRWDRGRLTGTRGR
jgi:hypothetical protein